MTALERWIEATTRRWRWQLLPLVLLLAVAGHAPAEDDSSGATEPPARPPGILPIPAYGGSVWNRSYLTGDWGGARTRAAEKGLQVDIDSVHWADTVVDGGRTDSTEIGGTFQYNIKWDLMRAGLVPGALIQLRAESRYGRSGVLNTGEITLPNMVAVAGPTNYSAFDEGYDLALSQLTWLQLFSEHVGVIAGKFDMYAEGDTNEFAGGRGRTQFMNWNLNVSTPALFVPAAALGAGVVILPNHNLTITSLMLNNTECTNNSCFDDLGENGWVSINTVSWQYRLGNLPGGVNASLFYFFDTDFTEIGTIAIVPGDRIFGPVVSEESESWQTSVSFWQYLSVKDQLHEGPLNLMNKQPDLVG